MVSMQTIISTPLKPKIVLGVAAHPDDLDYCVGATMAAFAQQGADVYYLVLTDGGKGSSDRAMTSAKLRDLRREEQRAAARALGVKEVFFCDYPDGELENTLDVKRDVVKIIRQVKPEVIVAPDPTVVYSAAYGMINHPDHRSAGQAAIDAAYPLARDHMTFPELLEQGLEPHDTPTLLLFSFDLDPERANYAVDITGTLELKFGAIEAHASQFADAKSVRQTLRDMASKAGSKFGYGSAEPFVRVDIV